MRHLSNVAVAGAAYIVFAAAFALPASAADPRYPDWPCEQLKVPDISLGAVWSGPPIDIRAPAKPNDPKLADLVDRLAARRTTMEDARKLISDFITGTPAERQEKAKALFAALYDTLNTQRHQVMDALERFSRKQRALADDIRTSIARMRDLQDTPGSNQAEVDDLGKRLQWETRIFSDRQKSTSYVCEVPVILEKRLFDLARAIQAAVGT